MIKSISFTCILLCLIQLCAAQTDKNKGTELSPELTKQLLSTIKPDTARILRASSLDACHCIDSFLQARKAGDPNSDIIKNVTACIESEVITYQMVLKTYQIFSSSDKIISINTNKNSAEYQSCYKDIEAWLTDSCSVLRIAMGSNDEKETELSFSKDPEAIKQYNAGIKYFIKEAYADAMPYFKKAVEADSKFVFALDNLAICYRKTGELDNALSTYKKSLEISPKGKTPLQNIPVIYELKKDYSKAIEGYKKFLKYFPDDAEAYYGMGRISIIYTNDLENGVDFMCKAYNIYVKEKSPYSNDAQKNIAYAYQKMKEQGKEELFFKILKDNNISAK
jgi:tetratricopeptide (TPR) repeat protein